MVVAAGETPKFAPLALEPMLTPPVGRVNHCIVFPTEVAFKLETSPTQIVAGEALTGFGVAGVGLTVTVTAVRVALTQVPPSASA